MMNKEEIFDGVIGGVDLSTESIRKDISEPLGLVVTSEIDRQLARLLTLHPTLPVKFRNNSLAGLDDGTKKTLLLDIQEVLGIVPLRDE